jgi:acetyltransferase-like isoleucine patch superfamily enzyme
VAHIIAAPLVLWYWLWVPLLGRDRAMQGSTEFLSLFPGISGQYLRRAFLTWTIEACHPTATVCFGTTFSKAKARLGANVYVGPGCHLGMVDIEDDVLLAAGVHVTSGARTHGYDDPTRPIREQEGERRRVRIGARSWIGSAAVIMADVGADVIIGAGAVVTKPIPEGVIAAGVPAQIIKQRFPPAQDAISQ